MLHPLVRILTIFDFSWEENTVLSTETTYDNKTLSTETSYQQGSIVGKVGTGMRCSKLNSTSNVLVCETQRKVYMYWSVSDSVSEKVVCVCVWCVCVLFVHLFQDDLR